MLTDLDETLHHQAPLTFDQVYTTDHRFYDRQLIGAFHPEGKAGFLAGITVFKNMNVMEGFVMTQLDGKTQYNLRFTKQLRPFPQNSKAVIGPLSIDIVEPFKHLRVTLEPGDYPSALDYHFHSVLPARLENPHQSMLDGRKTTDYLRYNQLGTSSGTISIAGQTFDMKNWFSWRDHSWGVRPGVGGFEPMTGTRVGGKTGGAVASASRTGGKGMFLLYMGFWNGHQGGGVQIIEDGEGKRIYTDADVRQVVNGEISDELHVRDVEHEINFVPGTRVFERATMRLHLANGETWEVKAQSVGSRWVYRGGGYDSGFNDGLGQGVWRSEELMIEQDQYDVSHAEDVIFPDGSVARPRHREQITRCEINGAPGSAYAPMFVIGAHPRFGFDE